MCCYRSRPSNCRANDHDKFSLFYRYMELIQELLLPVPGVLDGITALSAEEPKVKNLRGCLRLHLRKFILFILDLKLTVIV